MIPPSRTLAVATRDGILVPRVIAAAGDKAARRFLEFFAATIRNKNTRMANYRAAERFFEILPKTLDIGRDVQRLDIGEIADLGIGRDDLADDQPVEQHADGGEVLLDGRLLGTLGARSKTHRQNRQDHGADRRTGPRALSHCGIKIVMRLPFRKSQAAATTSRHVLIAAVRSV